MIDDRESSCYHFFCGTTGGQVYIFKVTLKQDASFHCVEVGRLQSRVYYFSQVDTQPIAMLA